MFSLARRHAMPILLGVSRGCFNFLECFNRDYVLREPIWPKLMTCRKLRYSSRLLAPLSGNAAGAKRAGARIRRKAGRGDRVRGCLQNHVGRERRTRRACMPWRWFALWTEIVSSWQTPSRPYKRVRGYLACTQQLRIFRPPLPTPRGRGMPQLPTWPLIAATQ